MQLKYIYWKQKKRRQYEPEMSFVEQTSLQLHGNIFTCNKLQLRRNRFQQNKYYICTY